MKILKKPLLALLILIAHVFLLAAVSYFTPFDVVEYIEGVGVMDFMFILGPSFVFLVCSRATFGEISIFLQLKFLVDAFLGNREIDLLLVILVVLWLTICHTLEVMRVTLNKKDGGEETGNGNQ